MKYHTLFYSKIGKMWQNWLSAAVVIGAFRVKFVHYEVFIFYLGKKCKTINVHLKQISADLSNETTVW